ncbi:MAG TPA: hypothetical protein VFS44_07780 [Gemmatimonadaceae bacterium]|nr:hypothetical protein [Gemmatimonadaceae bacterium]
MLALAAALAVAATACRDDATGPSQQLDGKEIFRFDTFGDEAFWTDTLKMNEVIERAVSPRTALSVGLKVDADALPPGILATADLDDPATTVALLKLNAVVGVQAQVDGNDHITRIGITCALCHSTVDNSVAPGIGKRLDGWPNREIDPGLILSLSPALQAPEQQAVLKSWGPGRYDARWNHDGLNGPVYIPPAYGLRGVALETYTGEGPVSYWNAYVAVTQMHGHGTFVDPRTGDDIQQTPDLVTPKLNALREYQLALAVPRPAPGAIDAAAAARGAEVFAGAGGCASCHVGSTLSDAGIRLHAPAETGMEPLHAERSTTKRYRTTPLRGLLTHPPYFHDGSAATLRDVIDHYDAYLHLGLTEQQKRDLEEYLRTL